MSILEIAKIVDLFASATVLGATVWFFFVQSPTLLRGSGREKFVPTQMRLTVLLFRTLSLLLGVSVATTFLHAALPSAIAISAGVALLGGLVNQLLVVPRALKAGGRSRKEIKGKDEEGSVANFASEGAGSRTKTLHRLVVLFVVVMLGGTGTHLVTLLGL